MGIVKLLLDHGANANIKGNNGVTALYSATSQGKEDVMKLLIKSGADINAPNSDGWTPLHRASSNSNLY